MSDFSEEVAKDVSSEVDSKVDSSVAKDVMLIISCVTVFISCCNYG